MTVEPLRGVRKAGLRDRWKRRCWQCEDAVVVVAAVLDHPKRGVGWGHP